MLQDCSAHLSACNMMPRCPGHRAGRGMRTRYRGRDQRARPRRHAAACGGKRVVQRCRKTCAVVQVTGDLGGLLLNLLKGTLREHGFLQRTKGGHLHAMREALPINNHRVCGGAGAKRRWLSSLGLSRQLASVHESIHTRREKRRRQDIS